MAAHPTPNPYGPSTSVPVKKSRKNYPAPSKK